MGGIKAQRSLRTHISAIVEIDRSVTNKTGRHGRIAAAALLSVSYVALVAVFPIKAHAQTPAPGASPKVKNSKKALLPARRGLPNTRGFWIAILLAWFL